MKRIIILLLLVAIPVVLIFKLKSDNKSDLQSVQDVVLDTLKVDTLNLDSLKLTLDSAIIE